MSADNFYVLVSDAWGVFLGKDPEDGTMLWSNDDPRQATAAPTFTRAELASGTIHYVHKTLPEGHPVPTAEPITPDLCFDGHRYASIQACYRDLQILWLAEATRTYNEVPC